MLIFFSHQARVQGSASEQRGLPSPRVPRAAAPRHRISPACCHCFRQDKSCVSSLNASRPLDAIVVVIVFFSLEPDSKKEVPRSCFAFLFFAENSVTSQGQEP
jgi:hypothetical protein